MVPNKFVRKKSGAFIFVFFFEIEQKAYDDQVAKDISDQRKEYEKNKKILLEQKRREQLDYENQMSAGDEELNRLSEAEKKQEIAIEEERIRLMQEAIKLLQEQEEAETGKGKAGACQLAIRRCESRHEEGKRGRPKGLRLAAGTGSEV